MPLSARRAVQTKHADRYKAPGQRPSCRRRGNGLARYLMVFGEDEEPRLRYKCWRGSTPKCRLSRPNFFG